MPTPRKVDVPGALLCAAGLAGPVFALIEQPRLGWSSPEVVVPLVAGVFLLGAFLWQESRAPDPMLPLGLFKRRNFSAGNVETFSMYAGLAVLFFFLILFLQQIGGYTPLQSGLATLPVTVIMFVLSRRFGALADRFGPRFFMGAGPLVAACGLLLFQRIGTQRRLRLGSAPGPARVRARPVDDRRAADRGRARRRGNLAGGDRLGRQQRDRARRRPARHRRRRRGRRGLLRLVARRAPVRCDGSARPRAPRSPKPSGCRSGARTYTASLSAQASALTKAAEQASLHSFHLGMAIAGLLVAVGGIVGVVGIRNPKGEVPAESCPGGQLVGASSGIASRAAEPSGSAV